MPSARTPRVVSRLRGYHEKMVRAGYQAIVFEDFLDMLADQLNTINGGPDALTLTVHLDVYPPGHRVPWPEP